MRTYDAGYEREALAHNLAHWKSAGFIGADRAARWERRLRRLAKATGLRLAEARAEINADADLILALDTTRVTQRRVLEG
jgi:hypothetical protein